MTLVKINALNIPPQAGDEVVKRFEARMTEMSTVAGFEGFELLRPTGEAEPRWFVYTRWSDEDAFQAWRNSETFANSHKAGGPPTGQAGGHPGGAPTGERPGNDSGGDPADDAPQRPVATGSALLEFEVAVAVGPAQS